MKRRLKLVSRRGLLLVEAVLSAVVIATGLAFISRGLGGQLGAIRRVEEHDTLVSLAQGKLSELEAARLAGRALPPDRAGDFEEPSRDYHWQIEASPSDQWLDQDGRPLATDVTVTVQRTNSPKAGVRLRAVWPADWVSQ